MHGKISYYSAKNESGTIFDKNRRIYELRASGWHDKSTIPSNGLYVTFRLDESGKVTDCKASKYQDFEKQPFVSEGEFWDSIDDDELEEIEIENIDSAINEEQKKLDFKNLVAIESNRSIDECLNIYFRQYSDILHKNKKLLEKDPAKIYDYAILKKFITKAQSQLLSIDKHLSPNEFSEIQQQISEVEFLVKNFKNEGEVNTEVIFSIFEKYQLKYHAAKKALVLLEDEKTEIVMRLKSVAREIEKYEKKESLNHEDTEALEGKRKYLDKLENELGGKKGEVEKLKSLITSFEREHRAKLPSAYKNKKMSLYKDLRFLLSALGDELDNKIHNYAMLSDSVINTYYKHNFEFPFCAMTFLHVYLKRLDKTKMQDRDKVAFNLYSDFEKTKLRKFLLITDSETIASSLRTFVLHNSKNHALYLFYKPIEFFSQAEFIRPEVMMVDLDTRNLESLELIKKCKKMFGNSTRIILFNRD
ncbi:MAG: hypothetical protein ACLFQJ_04480 [Campylobacterales bacterium]